MIKENLNTVNNKLKETCFKLNIDPKSITLVAVSKTKPLEILQEAIDAGNLVFGENKTNDLKEKRIHFDALGYTNLKWHFIGHLQTNKAKEIVKYSDIFQCLDSFKLANKLNTLSEKNNKTLEVYIQINSSGEESKSGIKEENLFEFAEELAGLENIRITGIMSIGKYNLDPNDSRPEFRKMKKIFEEFKLFIASKKENEKERYKNFEIKNLSMGMTSDFAEAIEEGANIVRVGTAIFGVREYNFF